MKKLFFVSFVLLSFNVYASSYVGGGYGYGRYDTSSTATNVALKDSKEAGTVFVGRLWAYKQVFLGLEVTGNQFSQKKWTISGDYFTLRSKTLDGAMVLKAPLSGSSVFVEAKGGYAYLRQETRSVETDPNNSLPLSNIGQTNSALKPILAIGAGADVSENLRVDVLYTHLFGDKSSAPIGSANNLVTSEKFNKLASLDSVLLRVAYQCA